MQERMKAEEVEKDKVKQTARSESNGKAPVWELNTSNTPSLKVENGDRVSLASNGNQ
jgi:hypothetical protein